MSSQLNGSSSTPRKIAAGLVSLVLFGATQLSHAAQITLQSTAVDWPTFSGPSGAQWNSDHTGLFWGTPTSAGGQSGLVFNTQNSNGYAVPLDSGFALGVLYHYNYAIDPSTAITNADLRLHLTLSGSGSGTVTPGPFDFNFSIFESPNNADCPTWQASSTPCDDKISFTPESKQFTLDGQLYSFNLLGFYKNPATLDPNMITSEQTTSSNWLYASITEVSTTPVPVPAALWLLGSGLLGLAGFAKRKRIPQ